MAKGVGSDCQPCAPAPNSVIFPWKRKHDDAKDDILCVSLEKKTSTGNLSCCSSLVLLKEKSHRFLSIDLGKHLYIGLWGKESRRPLNTKIDLYPLLLP